MSNDRSIGISQLSGHGRTEDGSGDGSSGTGQPTGHPTDKE